MMRCLGADTKQVRQYVRREALNWCRSAIPLGLGASLVMVWVLCAVLRFLSPYYSETCLLLESVCRTCRRGGCRDHHGSPCGPLSGKAGGESIPADCCVGEWRDYSRGEESGEYQAVPRGDCAGDPSCLGQQEEFYPDGRFLCLQYHPVFKFQSLYRFYEPCASSPSAVGIGSFDHQSG